jgi:outer membrane protein insertion porin family
MNKRITAHTIFLLLAAILLGTGCNTTRNLQENEYLLRSNSVKVRSDKVITQKGELKENMSKLIAQKPNSRILGIVPYKLWLYNTRYEKYQHDTSNFQLKTKTVERPVIYDSSLTRKSALNMKSYLFNQGYFYPIITDTAIFKNKKAFVTYNVETGTNYLINQVIQDIDDSTIAAIVTEEWAETNLKEGTEFNYSLLELEISRITAVLRNYGYYKFSNDNISFELDTLNKQYAKNAENAIESAINFIALQKSKKKPTLNVKLIIRQNGDPTSYFRYGINRIRVFPDFEGRNDVRDSTMIQKVVDGITFRYHNYYVRPGVIRKHIFIEPETYYAQKDYDQTISALNSLNIFSSVRIVFREDTIRTGKWLNCTILLSPGKKLDFNTSLEGSNGGSSYALGSSLTLSLRDRNLAKGANLFTTSLSGSIETFYADSIGKNVFEHFRIATKTAGVNTSIEFPKFLIPFHPKGISPKNNPHTIVGLGASLLDRINYFTLYNISANFTYKWKETKVKTWEVTPAFINYIRLPRIDSAFEAKLATNDYLKNTYKNTFIEGENVTFTFSDRDIKLGRNYSYLRVGVEEGGGLIGGISSLISKKDTLFAQYVKFDFDAQHFFTNRHSTVAMRFYGGVGLPYDKSVALPYIKQYYVGGPNSIRGWRIRTLGPGSYIDTSKSKNIVDRTGDIKLELNAEYRFDIVKVFSGAAKMNGALFADAGNIWLAKKSDGFPGAEFNFNKLGSDIAASVGAGVRFDISGFLVIRFDVGMPIKRPDYIGDGGWLFDKIALSDPAWKKDNLILNIAIGYPF